MGHINQIPMEELALSEDWGQLNGGLINFYKSSHPGRLTGTSVKLKFPVLECE